jgi:putative transposase
MLAVMTSIEDHGASATEKPAIRARIRRWYVPNAVYFITCVTRNRKPIFANADCLNLLRETLRSVRKVYPFHMQAYVFLPDHFHLLVHIPLGTDISRLMQSVQWNYALNHKRLLGITSPIRLWQRGFWNHVIRDEDDWERHFNYIHCNPVKHGYAAEPMDYPHSSFAEYVRRGWYGLADAMASESAFGSASPFEPGDSE